MIRMMMIKNVSGVDGYVGDNGVSDYDHCCDDDDDDDNDYDNDGDDAKANTHAAITVTIVATVIAVVEQL